MLPFAAAAFTFLALATLAALIAQRSAQPADARVRALGTRAGGRATHGVVPFQRRVIAPLIETIGSRSAALLPAAFLRRTERRVLLAGEPLSPTAFYTLVVAFGVLFGGGYLALVLAAAHGAPPVMVLLAVPMFGVLGLYLPVFWIATKAKARQTAMLRALPDTLDLLTLCVEAGLGLEGALHRVVEKQAGPLADEVRQTLREVGLGKSRRDALLNLAERTQLDDVRSLATALVQAEQLGTSAAKVLRAQSQRLRMRRRQRAEQDARRASVRMVFPLVFCLMPSLFMFILGPIIVSAYDFLSK